VPRTGIHAGKSQYSQVSHVLIAVNKLPGEAVVIVFPLDCCLLSLGRFGYGCSLSVRRQLVLVAAENVTGWT